jgi:predicted tellurium resistance membrane protein TerC
MFAMADAIGLCWRCLIGLELVLGVDNVLVIAIFVARLPCRQSAKQARIMGLALAMVARLVMLVVVVALASLTQPLVWSFLGAGSDICWPAGLFLLYKAVQEIHHTILR